MTTGIITSLTTDDKIIEVVDNVYLLESTINNKEISSQEKGFIPAM